MLRVRLEAGDDVDGFRRAVRSLIAEGVEPARVAWQLADDVEGDLLIDCAETPQSVHIGAPALRLPAFFSDLFDHAALHTDRDRHALLYRLAWRLAHEPELRQDALDDDRLRAERLAREVRREMHKMTAFVRFRPIAAPSRDARGLRQTTHIAWFEPAHPILRATAPFFARRFAQMHWAILTPEGSARWDGQTLEFGHGAEPGEAPPADAAERLWLTYYENIFNPARLKVAMMKKEMPRRYWKNLPEAALIQPLVAMSNERSARMIAQGGTLPQHRRPAVSLAMRIDRCAEARAAPDTLEALREGTQRCRACPIGALATQAVNGEGPVGARLMLVGEQPGDQEDLHGRPFVGPAGQLLDRALAQLGWPREALYITNALKHFKFELRGKRRLHKTPAQQEAAACLDWLEGEIALVRPKALVALGATAARSLLGRVVGVTAARGQWLARGDGLRVLVTMHPSALLRMPREAFAAAYEAWVEDLREAAITLAPVAGTRS